MTPPPLPGRCPCLSSRTYDCVTSRGKKAAADVVKVQEFALGDDWPQGCTNVMIGSFQSRVSASSVRQGCEAEGGSGKLSAAGAGGGGCETREGARASLQPQEGAQPGLASAW